MALLLGPRTLQSRPILEVDVIEMMDRPRIELTPPPDAFRALSRDFAQRLALGDTEGLVEAFYAEGARLLPPGSHPICGRSAIMRFWQLMADEGLYEADMEPTGIECAGRAAYILGRYSLRGARESAPPFKETGAFLVQLRLQGDGAWRAVEQTFISD
jgi:ketosteroid isomerase-like protein